MATLRNKRNLAAVSIETLKNTKNNQSQNILVPEMAQPYISQVSEVIEGRVTNELSKEFSRTESRILVGLSKLDEVFLNPQVWTCSVAVPGASTNNDSENRDLTGHRSLGNPCLEAMFSSHHSGNLNDSVLEKTHPMVTGVQQKTPYCSTRTSSGKQKKAHSTSQPKFRSENTPVTIEANQILSALQQLATSNKSATFNNNINSFSKLPKSLTTTITTLILYN